MTFTGPIYIRLRERMLAFFIDGCKASRQNRSNFGDWIRSAAGSFVVTSVTKQQIVIQTSAVEIGSVFLRDIEYFTDQCFEHILESVLLASDTRFRSEAWSVVTLYYYAFYAAQAMQRLLGEAVMFFDGEAVNNLRTLAATTVNPGAGVFLFSKQADLSATQSEYVFRKQKRRPHEAVWKSLLQSFRNLVDDPALATDAGELEFFGSLSTKRLFKIYADYDWPSKVRYRANYNPGFAYLLVSRKEITRAKRLIERWQGIEGADTGGLLRQSADTADCRADAAAFASHVQLLHDLAHSLFTLTRRLYTDLKERRSFDNRWELDRRKFLLDSGIDAQQYAFVAA